ncbi:AHH domain-containing protein [Teredinibacter sp. KSP-S5-2]|uniref:AHH domain-containing protein n=1 Tax=Teredinibacter sp. KSP-S5-2 TaxID=3034506 RepID=UPI002934E6DC|nr:AHH domain-containing protein [Teredinibacter sp. KSP-S5-2]WNO10287.1 AHH domain-containing protein [Teredinibacter sp. KSP-S5-2]WNO10294.1 AHH domain-containing protein [Teredinibacter sp. KSP-S5-2]
MSDGSMVAVYENGAAQLDIKSDGKGGYSKSDIGSQSATNSQAARLTGAINSNSPKQSGGGLGSFLYGMGKGFVKDTLHSAHTYITGVSPEEQGDPTGIGANNNAEQAGLETYEDNKLVINLTLAALPTSRATLSKFGKASTKADDVADSTVELAEQLKLSPTKQRELLRKAMGSEGSWKVAHHVIPLEAIKRFPELMKKAAKGGFNINGKNNGALLGRADHIGGHPVYNKAVMEQLGRISPNLSPARTAKEMQKASNTLQNEIQNSTFGSWG